MNFCTIRTNTIYCFQILLLVDKLTHEHINKNHDLNHLVNRSRLGPGVFLVFSLIENLCLSVMSFQFVHPPVHPNNLHE